MRTIQEVLNAVSSVPDFAGVKVLNVNTRGNFANYPLHVVAVWGDCEAIRLLLGVGAKIDQQGEHGFTPLMEAVAQGNEDAAELLISFGAKPIPNRDGQIPSAYAAALGNETFANRLREKGY